MDDKRLKRLTLVAGYLLLGSALLMWSWNTLAGLFVLPSTGFRHALAAFAIPLALRPMLQRGRLYRHRSGHGGR